MAFTPLYGCGFEAGSVELFMDADQTGAQITSTAAQVNTGTYAINIIGSGDWVRAAVSGTPAEVYVSVWVLPLAGLTCSIDAVMTDSNYCRIQYDAPNWDAYVSSNLVASGTVDTNLEYQNIRVRFYIDNAGAIQVYVDGTLDVDYSGDTREGVNTIAYIKVNGRCYVDDFAFGTGGWPPGGYRFDGLFPDGDDSVQWSRSTGSDNYALVDEAPPSDADYVYTTTDTHKDIYTLEDWDGTNKTPAFVNQWARAKKDEAVAHQLELVADDGTEDIDSPQDLLVSYKYINRIMSTPPSGGSWDDTAVDGLKVGQRAQIV